MLQILDSTLREGELAENKDLVDKILQEIKVIAKRGTPIDIEEELPKIIEKLGAIFSFVTLNNTQLNTNINITNAPVESLVLGTQITFRFITTYLPHPKLSHNENWSFGDLVLANCLQQRFAIAYQYFLVLVQNTTLNGDKNQKKPIVTPGGAECGLLFS